MYCFKLYQKLRSLQRNVILHIIVSQLEYYLNIVLFYVVRAVCLPFHFRIVSFLFTRAKDGNGY